MVNNGKCFRGGEKLKNVMKKSNILSQIGIATKHCFCFSKIKNVFQNYCTNINNFVKLKSFVQMVLRFRKTAETSWELTAFKEELCR